MPLHISSLSSGSNGNCYYVGDDHDAVLVDAGISCRETEKRLTRQGLSIGMVRAIFISHEHSDHTRGVEVLSRKHSIPVYITPVTRESGRLLLQEALTRSFVPDEPVAIGGLSVIPFSKSHDGRDPHSFTITGGGLTVGVMTDIGRACGNVIRHFNSCHAAFLEANYDPDMLEKGHYPYFLKQRIRGGEGHLSNPQALDIFLQHRSPELRLLLLSHLSAHNNHPELVRDLFAPHANGTHVVIASRHKESGVFTLL